MQEYNAAKFSSINPLQTQAQIERRWQECNFGCHTPSYRVMRHETTYHEFLNYADAVSPFASGVIDGIHLLIKGYIKEYLDRLAVLKKNPDVFASLMAALVRSGKTQEIFFPG